MDEMLISALDSIPVADLDKLKIGDVELDNNLVQKSPDFKYRDDIDKIIRKNLKEPDLIHFYIQDARDYIKNCTKQYDIIFHDGFAPHKQSVLWSEDFILKLLMFVRNSVN